MQYKTITLQLLEANPPLYEQLRQSRTLLVTLDRLASELRNRHHDYSTASSSDANAMMSDEQRSALAFELAVSELQDRIREGLGSPDPP
jgi:hypothetical protein